MDETIVFNRPELWLSHVPQPAKDGHKYNRGYVAVLAASELTGATRLAATACSRVGAGMVSVVAHTRGDVYRSTLPPDIMVHHEIPQKASVLLGGPGGITEAQFDQLIGGEKFSGRIFDAGAIPSIDHFKRLDDRCILTPHTGEFERLFGPLGSDAQRAARRIAAESGATVVLKSSKTIIAHQDGRSVVNTHTSPYLAKAGTGDVLAGLIAGLVAQGMPHFEACCAAVWMHGEAGLRIGPGLVAGEIENFIPTILTQLLSES